MYCVVGSYNIRGVLLLNWFWDKHSLVCYYNFFIDFRWLAVCCLSNRSSAVLHIFNCDHRRNLGNTDASTSYLRVCGSRWNHQKLYTKNKCYEKLASTNYIFNMLRLQERIQSDVVSCERLRRLWRCCDILINSRERSRKVNSAKCEKDDSLCTYIPTVSKE